MSFTSKIGAKLQVLKGLLADRGWADVPFDNTPPWLGRTLLDVVKNKRCALKPMYAYGVTAAAALAKVLEIPRISAVEFGVAGGAGLLALEAVAAAVEKKTGVGIDVIGFDTGVGLPKPEDYRDQPNMWFEGQLPMNRAALEAKLTRATLQIGPVRETLPYFLAGRPAPIGFVSQDFDLYSSTRDALTMYEADYDRLLPHVVTYFDDILGHTYNDFCGERRAIGEFNETFADRKLSPMYGLRYFLPRQFLTQTWPDAMYFAHFFQHPLYNELDSVSKAVFTDLYGRDVRTAPNAQSRAKVLEKA